jgi:hypothetical protein
MGGKAVIPSFMQAAFDHDHVARLEACADEIERTGESVFKQCVAETEIHKLSAQLERWRNAVAVAEAKDPSDERLGRARAVIAELETELSDWRQFFLKAWRPDRSKPN